MSDFKHSAVLFSGDDGLPLEFNIRNANEKSLLKSLIEHGGGLCSQSENAIHLVSSNVLNADQGKMLVSTEYVFDCVKENILLEVDKYLFVVKETQISDISDDESLGILMKPSKSTVSDKPFVKNRSPLRFKEKTIPKTSLFPQSSSERSADPFTSSNKSDSFLEESFDAASHAKLKESVILDMVSKSPRTKFGEINHSNSSENICHSQQWASTAKDDCLIAKSAFPATARGLSPIKDSLSLISPTKSQSKYSNFIQSQDLLQNLCFLPLSGQAAETSSTVTSSQPEVNGLDKFDNNLLEKAHNKQDEEDLSQSYTVSSSADALAASKPNSADVNSEEMLDREHTLPDSPEEKESRMEEYIKMLEEEVEEILKKPSPKSIQDKIILVKYVCFAKKLTPGAVLQSLHNL